MSMIRTLIVDDHDVVREGIRAILQDSGKFEIKDTADSAEQAMQLVHSNTYELIILDLSLPGMSGLEILKDIKRELPDVRILVVSMYPEEEFAIRVLKSGAQGYVHKRQVSEKLLDAVDRIMDNKYYVANHLTDQLINTIKGDSEEQVHQQLTDREYELMLMLAEGKEVKEIAHKLHLSEKTVGAHRRNILRKMGMKNVVELAIYAVKQDLI